MSSLTTPQPASLALSGLGAALRVRASAAMELAAVIAILEIGIWQWCGPYDGVFRALAAPIVALIVWRSHRRRALSRAQSDRENSAAPRDTLAQAWTNSAIVTLLLAITIPPLAMLLRLEGEGFRLFWVEKGTAGLFAYLAGKGAFIVAQQLLLQYFLAPCCYELIRQRTSSQCCAALIFGLVHLPSAVLVGITAVAGYCWLLLFARSGRIAPLVASHLLLAVLAHATLPERLTLNMRVGVPAVEIAERYQALYDDELAAHAREICSDRYYIASGGTDDDFIRALYHDVLLREQTMAQADVACWRPKLAAHTRVDLAMLFFSSPEFKELKRAGAAPRVAQRVDQRIGISLSERGHRRDLR